MENGSSALTADKERGPAEDRTEISLNREDRNVIVDTVEDHELQKLEEEAKKSLICCEVNRPLLYCKAFYFCYSAALGALWPYLPLYFRQLFLTPRQVGTIVASRTFVQFLCTPVWSGVAEKYNKHKLILLLAVTAWLLSTLGLLLVPAEEPKSCLKMSKRSALNDWYNHAMLTHEQKSKVVQKQDTNMESFPVPLYNMTIPLLLKYSAYDPDKHVPDLSRIYLLLLFITILGISISAPGLVLADICTLQRLGDKPEHYGRQVLWGSVGYGFFAFVIGASVSFLHIVNPCTKRMDINYVPCFYVFATFMMFTLLVGSQFQYDTSHASKKKIGFIDGLKTINDIHLSALLIVTFYCGMGSGFISTFLFWHLREMGALQIQLAVVSLINSVAEVVVFFLSDRVIAWAGHFRVIYLGLFCFALRFFYYSFLKNPWYVLPIELTQGMTSAAVRSALVSYVGQEPGAGNVLQGLFNGVHSGLGFSIGGLIGGFMVHEFGHSTTFLVFGEISLIMMFSFVLINNIWPHTRRELDEMKSKQAKQSNKTNSTILSSEPSMPNREDILSQTMSGEPSGPGQIKETPLPLTEVEHRKFDSN